MSFLEKVNPSKPFNPAKTESKRGAAGPRIETYRQEPLRIIQDHFSAKKSFLCGTGIDDVIILLYKVEI